LRGIPASVTDPTPRRSFDRSFTGHRHGHDRSATPVFAVPYYGYYGDAYDASGYDASSYDQPQAVQQQAPPPQVIIIKDERSSRDAADSPYGDEDVEEGQAPARPSKNQVARASAAPAPPAPQEQLPVTTLIYRDGHKAELRNYAIVGSNLIDLTKSSLPKKIPLASLDLEATRHQNEENGVDFHLP
jgi:hypothetical protein